MSKTFHLFGNKLRYSAFRNSYWKSQLKKSVWASGITLLLSTVALLVTYIMKQPTGLHSFYALYGALTALSGLGLIFGPILLHMKLSDSKKARASSVHLLLLGVVYLHWSVYLMDVNAYQEHPVTVLPWFIVLAILTAFFYYTPTEYLIMVVSGYAAVGIAAYRYNGMNLFDFTTSFHCVVLTASLFILGISRYRSALHNFEATEKNRSLIDDLNANNQELLAMNEELEDTTQALRRSNKIQKSFSAAMNHELRAPLNGIMGSLQTLLMDTNRSTEDQDLLTQCMASGRAMNGIVNDLLDFAKLDAGEFVIINNTYDLRAIIHHLVTLFGNSAREKGLALNVRIPEDTPCILFGDDVRIRQIITNLLSNAIKYTKEGSVTLMVELLDSDLVIRVSDTGQGIAKESLPFLFTPFKRLNEAENKKIQGTGLGLYIVDKIVRQMKGETSVASEFGKGSTFTVRIPTEVRDSSVTWSTPLEKTNSSDPRPSELDLGGIRILYIDDTELNLKVISKMLERLGATIDTNANPFEGLKMAKAKEYDYLFLDHQMPGMDGIELLHHIREEEGPNQATPAVAFTGNAQTGAAEMYQKEGFSSYLSKPILLENLVAVLRNRA